MRELIARLRAAKKFARAPIAAIALFSAAVYAFLQIADEVSENEIAELDRAVFLLFRNPADHNDPLGPAWFEEAVAEITTLGGYPVLVILTASVFGFLMVARRYGAGVFLLASVLSGTAVSQVLKMLYDRPRPDLVDHLVGIKTASFPSGHATMSTVVYLTLAALIVPMVPDTRVRAYVLAAAVLIAVIVGLSRIYLGVHWPSDVAAGWMLGAAWASLTWLAASLRERRAHSPKG